MKNIDQSNLNDKDDLFSSIYKDHIIRDCKYNEIEFSNDVYLKLKSTYFIDLINNAIFQFSGWVFLIGAVPFVASMFIHLPKIVNQISLAVTVISFIIVVISVCFQQIVKRKKMRLLEEVKGQKIFTEEVDKVKKAKVFLFWGSIAVIVILIAWFCEWFCNTEIGKSPLTNYIVNAVLLLLIFINYKDVIEVFKKIIKKQRNSF